MCALLVRTITVAKFLSYKLRMYSQVLLNENLQQLILNESDLDQSDLTVLLNCDDETNSDVTSDVCRSTLVGFPSRPLWRELDVRVKEWIQHQLACFVHILPFSFLTVI